MNIKEFHELPQLDNMLHSNKLEEGDKFLTGAKVINQVNNKSIGDIITYYVVTKVQQNGNVSYAQKMERLTGIQEDNR